MFLLLSLIMLQTSAVLSATDSACPEPRTIIEPGRRLVFSNFYSLGWSVLREAPVPSGEISLFLGGSLQPRFDRRGITWKTALGYQFSGSLGGADFAAAFLSWGGSYGVAYHRHHFAALGFGGPNQRLFYNFGGGLLLWSTSPIALEADARLGIVLGTRRTSRVKGVVGGQTRVIGIFEGRVTAQLGIFAGFFVF